MDDLYAGLRALADSAFPKTCRTCGRVYATAQDFLAQTREVSRGSGLKSSLTEEDVTVVLLFRNCVCGSTLMDEFANRRDDSPEGANRRRMFEQMLATLKQYGLDEADARRELRKMLRGERSAALEELGVRFSR